MSDPIDRAAEVARRERTSMEVCQAHHITPAPSSAWSLLTALESVLDGMPAHDAAVAAKALRDAANLLIEHEAEPAAVKLLDVMVAQIEGGETNVR